MSRDLMFVTNRSCKAQASTIKSKVEPTVATLKNTHSLTDEVSNLTQKLDI